MDRPGRRHLHFQQFASPGGDQRIRLASLAIAIHLIPSTPYPVLQGTPGPLISFLGTNGNWGILIFTLVLLLIDSAAYIPFVKMALVVENRLILAEQDVISHEKND